MTLMSSHSTSSSISFNCLKCLSLDGGAKYLDQLNPPAISKSSTDESPSWEETVNTILSSEFGAYDVNFHTKETGIPHHQLVKLRTGDPNNCETSFREGDTQVFNDVFSILSPRHPDNVALIDSSWISDETQEERSNTVLTWLTEDFTSCVLDQAQGNTIGMIGEYFEEYAILISAQSADIYP